MWGAVAEGGTDCGGGELSGTGAWGQSLTGKASLLCLVYAVLADQGSRRGSRDKVLGSSMENLWDLLMGDGHQGSKAARRSYPLKI